MGWLTEEKKGKELLIGDEPLDIAGEMLDKLRDAYESEMGRKPTADEVAKTIEIVLASSMGNILKESEDKDIAEVAIKLKKRAKWRRPEAGDYYAVPLESGQTYGFIRVIDPLRRYCIFIDVLDYYSSTIPSLGELAKAPIWKEALCSTYALRQRIWPFVGNRPTKNPPSPGRSTTEIRKVEDDILFNRVGGTISNPPSLTMRLEQHMKNMENLPDQ